MIRVLLRARQIQVVSIFAYTLIYFMKNMIAVWFKEVDKRIK